MAAVATPLGTPEQIAKYEPVIGLEVHVQLGTNTKIFCSCPNEFGSAPNTNVCPVCLGMPGALPVLNHQAVELAIQASYALHCEVRNKSIFARKNYFYPDLPKGYQISQFDKPLSEFGWVDVVLEDGSTKRIGITRIHMEDDAGKNTHDGYKDSDVYSYVDLNRCGSPLTEIVSEPDMRSSEEAFQYLTELKLALQFVGVSSCDMEKGHLRCDANVSVRLKGTEPFGTKVEIKNLNSFRFLRQAIDFEIARQVGVLEAGGRIIQETRLYNADLGETFGMRSKEQAHDYRYFPEPDLVPLAISDEWKERVRAAMPELPADMRRRFIQDYELRKYDAEVLTATRAVAEFYETVARVSGDPKLAANWVTSDLFGLLKADGREIEDSPVTGDRLGELVALVAKGELTGKLAKEVLPKMFTSGDSARAIMEREGLKAMNDSGEIERIIDQIVTANPKQVEQYKGGKTTVIGFFVGQVMKASRGQANPATVTEILKQKLG
ncbi:Asp-tRNA(Asn)/Glu-tRNA(Gln) amidotransferase subunit GatB [uncultured Paludibaculum sp.]|uniref:Asp-tRNA(Asn)/Glu-tRNA(Gln) amidotransferase subunit GatB n=1 Tax=uncultured Paludibaculum sp. TaxID=1765020 RepID=UPI002AABEB2B|nr:Asp-tRNA(Asn)/Glu-tRNA(Gln) amidotransferase subunit GatB [uncultured Paludibaculum sp.]